MQQDTTERPGRRQLTRELRRQQLIDATVKCISKKGIGGTTLADVAREAGLSQGIVNLHFESKDNLLAETLRFLAEEYDEHFMRTLGKAPDHPAARLQAIMEMDLMPAVCDRHKLAVWFAFWGEVQAVPTYQKICAARDEKYDEIMIGLTDAVIEEGGYEGIDRVSGLRVYVSNNVPVTGGTTPTTGAYSIVAGHSDGITFANQLTKYKSAEQPDGFYTNNLGIMLYGALANRPYALASVAATKAA